jgi:crossover junction endonuclease MUS81
MILLVDFREKIFIDALNKMGELSSDSLTEIHSLKINDFVINYKICNLDIGDFLICNSDDTTNNIYENLLLLIERKTLNDLSSSIIDGRFREQKSRIEQSINDNNKIMYIIEGNRKDIHKNGVKNNILEGAILNMIFKHKFKLINTINIQDTIDTILTIFKKYKNNEYTNDQNSNNITDINFSNIKKSDRINNNLFNLQLCVIPGVSIKIAKSISIEYKNMLELVNAYNNLDNLIKKQELLADIKINNRKLGKALSKKIYNAITINANDT